ncbi:PKD domain-containing protein, partial [Candidatus Gracilibacteria bacterium]|nr:PKD domain-containing protein [Candidatus Gracilibacteria bacterium]
HRRNTEDIIKIVEKVYIGAVRKEAIISLRVETDTQYAPATVSFDASLSFIRDDDIVKFIYDYGNGIIEERDSINPGHRYREPGEYTITLTAVGSRGGRYSTQETLILLPTPQRLEVDSSMRRAPVGQGIDFSSAGSQGQIAEYFWDFGDGNVSTLPNPSHTYRRPGTYNVSLEANFTNFNTRTATMQIEIYE